MRCHLELAEGCVCSQQLWGYGSGTAMSSFYASSQAFSLQQLFLHDSLVERFSSSL